MKQKWKAGEKFSSAMDLDLNIKRKAAIQARHSHLFRRLAAILQKKDAHVSRKIAPADTVHRLRGEFYAVSFGGAIFEREDERGRGGARVLIRFSVADTERVLPQIHEDLLRGVCRSELSGAEAEWLSGGEGGLSSSSSCSRGPRANSTTLHIISSWRL